MTSGRHSVHPVAISTIVSVWMNEPATDVPPCATMSISQKPGGGSPVVERADRHLAPDRRVEADTPTTTARRRDLHVDRAFDRWSRRSPRATERCSPSPSCNRPCCSSAGSKGRDHRHEPLAAHTIRRLPQRRQRVLDRCAVAALALTRSLGSLAVFSTTRRRNARTACLRCQPVVWHSSSRMRPFSARPADR